MAGVRDITPGFAQECFGKLRNEAKRMNSTIRFEYVEADIQNILLSGIKAERERPA
jgi:hypothetical protein